MKYARCKKCRSECWYRGEWQHVYERASPNCVVEIDESTLIDVDTW